jgi:hypothetical protein
MASHGTPQARHKLVAWRVGPLAVTALVLLGSAALSGPAPAAAPACGNREEIVKTLEQRHEELPSASGVSADGAILEVLVSPEGAWTILVTYPKQPSCILAVGDGWQTLELVGRPA